MRYFVFVVLIFVLGALKTNVWGQNSLSGLVKQADGDEALIGATLFLPDLRVGAMTDENGKYAIHNLPKGNYLIEIQYVGYKTLTQKINIDGSVSLDFVLEPAVVTLEEVVVSGAGSKTVIKESPVPITTFSRAQWLQSSSVNLVDAVAKTPGMSQISTGVGLSKPIIRGLGFNRVITMHDGVRQEDNQWGEEHSLHIDEFSIDRYEIIRGAGSLMYGSDGLGGVLSILSPRPVSEGQIIGQVLMNYQSNNGLLGGSAMTAGNLKGLVWLGRFSYKNTQNYYNPVDGRVFGSNYNEMDGNGMVGLNRKWGYIRLMASSFNQKINIIDGLRDSLGQFLRTVALNDSTAVLAPVPDDVLNGRGINPANSQSLSNHKIGLNTQFKLGGSTLSVNLSYSQNHRREYANVLRPETPNLYFLQQTMYYDVRFNLPALKEWETTIGSNGMFQSLSNRGAECLYPEFNLFDNGVFIFTRKKFKRLILSGGVRYDLRSMTIAKLYIDAEGHFQNKPDGAVEERFAGFSKNYVNITGSVGAVYRFTEQFSMKLNAARAFRAPTVPELSSNGEHAGTFRYEIGNLQAKAEAAYQTDLGFNFDSKNLYFDVTLFQNYIQNYSYSERVLNVAGQDSLVGRTPVFHYTQGNAILFGGEFQATYAHPAARWISLTQSFSLAYGQNLSAKNDSAQYLPFMPPPRWITQLKFSREKFGSRARNLYVSVELEINQKQNRPYLAYQTETATPAYLLLNAGFGGDVTNRKKQTLFSLYLVANNLTNAVYQAHQSRLKYLDVNQTNGRRGVWGMGFNLSVKLVVPITFKKGA